MSSSWKSERLVSLGVVLLTAVLTQSWQPSAAAAEEYRYRRSLYPLTSREFPSDSRLPTLNVFGYFGFAGEFNTDFGDVDMNPSVGVMGRLVFPVHPLFALGLQTGGIWFGADDAGDDSRDPLLDVDAYLRLRYPFFLRGLNWGEVYLGVPVGFTAAFLDDVDRIGIDKTGLGWNIGTMFGTQFFFGHRLGAMAELGWTRHAVSHDVENGAALGIDDIDYDFNQFVMQIGFSVLLGHR